jgi:hypothetical protein
MNYEYDEEAASHAEDFANRIDENGLYIGRFKRADAIESANTGTKGIEFEFEMPGGGNATFSLYTEKSDGTRLFGFNKVMALMTLFRLRTIKAMPGKVSKFDADEGKRVEMDGEVYPDLLEKDIGVALSKELYTSNSGKDSYRMNLETFFDPKTKLTASEIKEGKAKPEKLERIVKQLKTKDSRVKKANEPAQPSAGAPVGDY